MYFRAYTQEDFIVAIRSSRSLRQALLKLGVSDISNNYRAAKKRIRLLGLDTSHFTARGAAYRRGHKFQLKDYLVKNSSRISSHNLKLRLLEEKIFEAKCSSCGLIEWLGKPAPLELNHIDGDHFNNELCNLELLCPNCHAFTPIYRGRGRKMIKRRKMPSIEAQ